MYPWSSRTLPLFGKIRIKIVKGYGAAREKNAQLREALSAANTVMAENMTQMMVMALMFDLMADGNLALAEMWYVKT
ncbi:hypothetical protein YC2023_111570 [Brassica napus]